MNFVKTAGTVLGVAVYALGLIFLVFFFIKGATYVSVIVLPYLDVASVISIFICIFILLPISFFRSTRIVSCIGFFIISFVFGLELWMYSFIVVYALWGGLGLFIGLCLAGLGVAPLGFIAALLHGEWYSVAQILFGFFTTFGARAFSAYLAQKVDEAQSMQRFA